MTTLILGQIKNWLKNIMEKHHGKTAIEQERCTVISTETILSHQWSSNTKTTNFPAITINALP